MVNMPSAGHVPCQRAILAMHALGNTMTVAHPHILHCASHEKSCKGLANRRGQRQLTYHSGDIVLNHRPHQKEYEIA
jgi:hypothetical protein